MKEMPAEKEALQWHPAFFAGIQIELKDDKENLSFENEHQLSTKPMEIDVLVIVFFRRGLCKFFTSPDPICLGNPEETLDFRGKFSLYRKISSEVPFFRNSGVW